MHSLVSHLKGSVAVYTANHKFLHILYGIYGGNLSTAQIFLSANKHWLYCKGCACVCDGDKSQMYDSQKDDL